MKLLAEWFDRQRVVCMEENAVEEIGLFACPVLESILNEVSDRKNKSSQVPDHDGYKSECDVFDPSPFSLDDHYIVDPRQK